MKGSSLHQAGFYAWGPLFAAPAGFIPQALTCAVTLRGEQHRSVLRPGNRPRDRSCRVAADDAIP